MSWTGVEALSSMPDSWSKPFFASDNQYCFYVLPSGVSIVPLPDVQDVGSFSLHEASQYTSPPLVFQGDPPPDALPAQSPDIVRTIQTRGTIQFGSSRIGVSGSVGDLAGKLQSGGLP